MYGVESDSTPTLEVLAPTTTTIQVPIAPIAGSSYESPSVVATASGFVMLVRSTTLLARDELHEADEAHDDGHSEIRWVEFDDHLQVRSVRPLRDRDILLVDAVSFTAGSHGLQLFQLGEQIWVSGHSFQNDGNDARVIALGLVDEGTVEFKRLARLPVGYDPRDCHPVSDNNATSPSFTASSNPMRVLTLDESTGRIASSVRRRQPHVTRHLRSLSSLVRWDDGYLALMAEMAFHPDGLTEPSHSFVAYDAQFRLIAMTSPFALARSSTSSWAGVSAAHDRVVVAFRGLDQEYWATSTSISEVRSLLQPLPAPDAAPSILQAAKPRVSKQGERGAISRRSQQGEPSNGRSAPDLIIASTTISGNSEELIADALRSVVDWVDLCVLIDTGITDRTIDVAREIVGDKLVVRSFPWQDDFSAARNAALQFAHETGADWSVTLDTDERIKLNDVDIRAYLSETSESTLLVPHDSGNYTKDRFFRLPAIGEFRGATHEAFYRTDIFGGATVTVGNASFTELPKSDEAFRFKFERDYRVLLREIEREPTEPRWLFYLGDALQRLGRHEEAADAFRRCASMRGWEEESAWAMYRAAECLSVLGKFEEALDACAVGLTRHAGIPELPWGAGYFCLQLNRPEQAVYWAKLAIATGNFAGTGRSLKRVGWSYPWGAWEGPYDILRFALRAVGDQSGAEEAERLFHEAAAARKAAPARFDV